MHTLKSDVHKAGQHAEVAPASIVSMLSLPLTYSGGDVELEELTNWSRGRVLSDSERAELRGIILHRIRRRGLALWDTPVGIGVRPGWDRRLSSDEIGLVEGLAKDSACPFEARTLRELKQHTGIALPGLLSLLARMEAGCQASGLAAQGAGHAGRSSSTASVIAMTDSIKELGARVMQLGWLDTISPGDLRFSYPSTKRPSVWLAEKLGGPFIKAQDVDWMNRLLLADSLTAEDEAKELLDCAAAVLASSRSSPSARARSVKAATLRFISASGPGRTLVDVGNSLDLTRERVRQLCDKYIEVLSKGPVATPSLDRVLRVAQRTAPLELHEMDQQVRPYLGEGFGLEAALHWGAEVLKRQTALECTRVRSYVRGEFRDTWVVQARAEATWAQSALRHAYKDCSTFGCTSLLRVAGHLALKEEVAPGMDALESILQATGEFLWLDQAAGWFTLGDSSYCNAANRIRKLLAIAESPVGADEIAAALASDDVWLSRENTGLGLATPPVHVLREVMKTWPMLRVVQKGRFEPAPGHDFSSSLNETECRCLSLIAAHDGVATKAELKDVVTSELEFSDALLSRLLGSSPVFLKLEHGLYAARGRRIGDNALAHARQRQRSRLSAIAFPSLGLKADEFLMNVTEAALRNEQYHFPVRFLSAFQPGPIPVLTPQGQPLGTANLNRSGVLTGLHKLFPEVRPGLLFRVTARRGELLAELLQDVPPGGPGG